ncbi:hypothetical protein ACSSS7_006056 [Eimeria intestinalis]
MPRGSIPAGRVVLRASGSSETREAPRGAPPCRAIAAAAAAAAAGYKSSGSSDSCGSTPAENHSSSNERQKLQQQQGSHVEAPGSSSTSDDISSSSNDSSSISISSINSRSGIKAGCCAMEGLGFSGARKRSLSDHALLQQLQRGQDSLLSSAVAASPSECLVLLPEESQLKGFQLDRVFLETHVLQQTAYPDILINLRGQEVERRGDELITSLGFRAKVSVSVLREERMFESGCAFSCLLVSSPLLPLPPGRRAGEGAGAVVSSRRPQGGFPTGGAPQGPPVSAEEAVLSSLSSTDTQLKVERLWKQGPQGPLAERLRIGQLITACCRQVPSTLASPKEAYRLLERCVLSCSSSRSSSRNTSSSCKRGRAAGGATAPRRGLEVVRMDPAAAASDLGLRRELQGVVPTQAAKELMKKIYEACDAAVAAAHSRTPVGLKQRQPVEVACEDLVALLVLAVADSGGEALVASYLHMSVLLLQQQGCRPSTHTQKQKPNRSSDASSGRTSQHMAAADTNNNSSSNGSSSRRQRQTSRGMQQQTATDARQQQRVEAARGPELWFSS